jgi:hypothetical protein
LTGYRAALREALKVLRALHKLAVALPQIGGAFLAIPDHAVEWDIAQFSGSPWTHQTSTAMKMASSIIRFDGGSHQSQQ